MKTWLSLVSALAVLLAAAALPGQSRRGKPIATRPFAFRLSAPGQPPSLANGRVYLARWLDAVERHEPGTQDEAAGGVTTWTVERLADVVNVFEIDTDPSRSDSVGLLKRAVLLHTDVAFRAAARGANPDIPWRYATSSLHLGVAFELVNWLGKRTTAEDAFIRAWCRAVASALGALREIQSTPVFVEWAVSRFPGEPDLLFLAGTVHEVLASPQVQEDPDTLDVDKCGSAEDNLFAAEGFYERALTLAPALTEVRARFGRVVGQMGRHEQALVEMRRALHENLRPELTYYVNVFIGENEEALGRTDRARAAYETAIELQPEVQFAYLALSRLERSAGNRPASVHAVQRMLTRPVPATADFDAWGVYYTAGEALQAGRHLEEFRDIFRRAR